jgi:hypothetical protein
MQSPISCATADMSSSCLTYRPSVDFSNYRVTVQAGSSLVAVYQLYVLLNFCTNSHRLSVQSTYSYNWARSDGDLGLMKCDAALFYTRLELS